MNKYTVDISIKRERKMSDEIAFLWEMQGTFGESSTRCPQVMLLEMQAVSAEEPKQRRRRRRKMIVTGSSKKRKLKEEQAEMLERSFVLEQKLESERKERLAAELGLHPNQVAVWYQNRRARWKIKKLQDDYFSLRSQHDGLLLHNCRLEAQVLKLKEELNEAKKEVERLVSAETLMRCYNSTPTPCSSLTIDTKAPMAAADPPPLLGDFDFLPTTAAFHFEDQLSYNITPAFGFDLWTI